MDGARELVEPGAECIQFVCVARGRAYACAIYSIRGGSGYFCLWPGILSHRRKLFHVKPHSACVSVRNRSGTRKKHSGPGSSRQRIVPARHCIPHTVYLPTPACCGSGTREL